MASLASCCSVNATLVNSQSSTADQIRTLYPAVNEDETPLPRQWNPKDKSSLLGLSQNNLTVHYRGLGKNHKDAASVRTTNPIPGSCGIYYFEVTCVSKGRDGYMGIGLSASTVSNGRLPGWDKNSYGYHGDDGNSFCSSGTGQPYGPTFTTGDVIGCCVNLIDGTCFYTKNGANLGIAFRDLPPNLYPTIGLQTPGEIVEANFGQSPFMYNIEDDVQEWRQKTREKIENFTVPNKTGEWQQALQKIVSTYLVHHGYCATAEAFLRSTGQSCDEELASIQSRQKIQALVLAGRIGEAIATTQQLYPGLLECNTDLLFALRCRQFIEIVNGTEGEQVPTDCAVPRSRRSARHHSCGRSSATASPSHISHANSPASQRSGDGSTRMISPPPPGGSSANGELSTNGALVSLPETVTDKNAANAMNGESHLSEDGHRPAVECDTDMDTLETEEKTVTNGSGATYFCVNGVTEHVTCSNPTSNDSEDEDDLEAEMEVDPRQSSIAFPAPVESEDTVSPLGQQLCGGSESAVRQLLQFGRYLHQLSEQLAEEGCSQNDVHRKALRDAFSLLAYSDPWNSPIGYQLNPVQRESVCTALNSAILELQGLPKQPPLELAIAHANQCIKLMSKSGIGSCAFANITDYLQ